MPLHAYSTPGPWHDLELLPGWTPSIDYGVPRWRRNGDTIEWAGGVHADGEAPSSSVVAILSVELIALLETPTCTAVVGFSSGFTFGAALIGPYGAIIVITASGDPWPDTTHIPFSSIAHRRA